MSEDFWAITSFFNPSGYASRLLNYRVFRQHLDLPLITVELTFDAAPQLDASDADRLIQLSGGDILWQKERLLNVALAALPNTCRYVAWLDCDIVFRNPRWHEITRDALARARLVQPYSWIVDLPRGAPPRAADLASILLTRESMARRYRRGAIDYSASSTNMLSQYSPGHAWAAHREVLEGVAIYDAMILGSGDFALGLAAIGRHADVPRIFRLTSQHAEHYLAWGNRFHSAIRGRLGCVEGQLLHLWHGDLGRRGYDRRYRELTEHEFDPFTDIALDDSGCWRWLSDKPALHGYVRDYFRQRKEDG